jgi:hypothetical protein
LYQDIRKKSRNLLQSQLLGFASQVSDTSSLSTLLVDVCLFLFGQKVSDLLLALLLNGLTGWAVSFSVALTNICTYYPIRHRLSTSTVTIRRWDDLFLLVVKSLRELRQPSSILVVAISDRASAWGSDSDSTLDTDPNEDEDDGSGGKLGCGNESTLVRNEPNFGINMYWYNYRPMWVRREFLAGSGGSGERHEEVVSLSTWSLSPKRMSDIISKWVREQRDREDTYTVIREVDTRSWNLWSNKTLKRSRSLESIFCLGRQGMLLYKISMNSSVLRHVSGTRNVIIRIVEVIYTMESLEPENQVLPLRLPDTSVLNYT